MAGPGNQFSNAMNMNEDLALDFIAQQFGVSLPEAQSMQEAAAYARNAAHAGGYTRTTLGSEEPAFVQWANRNRVGWEGDLTPAYDMRGYWKALMQDPTLAPKLSAHSTTGLIYPPRFDTPYSFGFGPRSQYWKP